MTRIRIADFKKQLSRHLRAVEQGAEIEVTARDRPIVRLVPARPAQPSIRIVPARRPFAAVRNRRYPKARWRSDSLRLLLEERGQLRVIDRARMGAAPSRTRRGPAR